MSTQLLSVFAIAFTAATFANALVLLYGMILARGRRMAAAASRPVGLADSKMVGFALHDGSLLGAEDQCQAQEVASDAG